MTVQVAPEELKQRQPEPDLQKAKANWQALAAKVARFATPDTMLNRIVAKAMLDGYYLTKRWNGQYIVFDSGCYRCQWDDASRVKRCNWKQKFRQTRNVKLSKGNRL